MRVFSRVLVAAMAMNSIGVVAVKGKGNKKSKGSSAGNVLSGIFSAAGMGLALGAMPQASGVEVHPLYHSTHNDLSSLLSKPCTQSSCPMEDRFRMWANEMKKPYVTQQILADEEGDATVKISPSEGREEEYAARMQAFANNVKNAHGYNVKSEGRSVHGITKFMDMPEEEFMKQRGGMVVDDAAKAKFKQLPKFEKSGDADFMGGKMKSSGSKDWAADGYTTKVKDQGQCGSCWAFSTTEQVESMAIKNGITGPFGDNYVLAPQELVSCDHNGDEGCGGGLPSNALEWLETHGLEQEDDYPYMSGFSGKSGKCKERKSKEVVEVTSFKQVASGAEDEDDMTDYLLSEGPLSVGVDANNVWQTYIGGVLTADQCDGQLDHAVQAVGADTDAGELKVRNSWGDDWGEHGFIRLTAGTNTCGIAEMAVTADVTDMSAKKKEYAKGLIV